MMEVGLFMLPFWPGLPGRRDLVSQWDYLDKSEGNVNDGTATYVTATYVEQNTDHLIPQK